MSLKTSARQLSLTDGDGYGEPEDEPADLAESRGAGPRHLGCQWAGAVDHKSRTERTKLPITRSINPTSHFRTELWLGFGPRLRLSLRWRRRRSWRLRCGCHWKSLIECRATTATAAPSSWRIYAILDLDLDPIRAAAGPKAQLYGKNNRPSDPAASCAHCLTASRWPSPGGSVIYLRVNKPTSQAGAAAGWQLYWFFIGH